MGGAGGAQAHPIIEDQKVFYYIEPTKYFCFSPPGPTFIFEPTQYFDHNYPPGYNLPQLRKVVLRI